MEEILEQIEGFSKNLPQETWMAELKKQSREIGKRQNRIYRDSEEYNNLDKQRELIDAALGILHEKALAESGLVPLGTLKSQKEKIEVEEIEEQEIVEEVEDISVTDAEAWLERYKKADKEAKQKMYREVSILAEKGDRNALVLLAMTYRKNQHDKLKQVQSIRLLKKAAEYKSPTACEFLYQSYLSGVDTIPNAEAANTYLEKASMLGNKKLHLQFIESIEKLEQKYEEYKKYIVKYVPLNMNEEADTEVLYKVYSLGYDLDKNMDKENIPEKLDKLLMVEKYTKKAKKLKGKHLKKQGNYEEFVQINLESGLEGIQEIENIFFDKYFEEHRELQVTLDRILEKKAVDLNTDDNIRAELNYWYGNRYELGKDKIKSEVQAFIHYSKAANLNSSYKEKVNQLLLNAKQKKNVIFLKELIDEGCYDVAEILGDIYENKREYDKALIYYRECYERGLDKAARERCSEKYGNLDRRLRERKIFVDECDEVYVYCSGTNIGRKKESFEKLRQMAAKGNYYAGMRYAQIAEKDFYLKENAINFPNQKELYEYYYRAASNGEEEAILKMIEIYSKGLLGKSRSYELQKKWEQRL